MSPLNLQKYFISGVTPYWAIRSAFSAFFKVIARLLRKKNSKRFLLLSPPCLRLQYVYDRQLKQLSRLAIRDRVDLGTVRQIFQAEDYGLFRLKRYDEFQCKYQAILSAGGRPVIFDFGSNLGASAKYFSLEWPEALVICVEPSRDNHELSRLNNSSKNISFYLGAIGAKTGRANLVDPGVGNNGYRTETSESGSLQIFSVDELLRIESKTECRPLVPFIAKVDIEGAESELFSENTEWVSEFALLIVELHDWMLPSSASSASFLKVVSPLRRDFVYIGENIFSIKNPS
jgi:FkbM family methyltransferase